jgi:hypothetical protein
MTDRVQLDPRLAGILGVTPITSKPELAEKVAALAGVKHASQSEAAEAMWAAIGICAQEQLIDHGPDVMDSAEASHYVVTCAKGRSGLHGLDERRDLQDEINAQLGADPGDDALLDFVVRHLVVPLAQAGVFRLVGRYST